MPGVFAARPAMAVSCLVFLSTTAQAGDGMSRCEQPRAAFVSPRRAIRQTPADAVGEAWAPPPRFGSGSAR
jgi:hypothetical protein